MEKEAQELYEIILRTATTFLRNAKHFTIELLNQWEPSHEEIAALAGDLADLIWVIADDFDPMMHTKAVEYAGLMKEMAKAISIEDEEDLRRVVDLLDRKPML